MEILNFLGSISALILQCGATTVVCGVLALWQPVGGRVSGFEKCYDVLVRVRSSDFGYGVRS